MRVGIDLGGTKIEGVALDGAGQIAARHRIPTPGDEGYGAVILAIANVVSEIEARVGKASSVGVGTPGSLSPVTGLMRNSNTVCLNGRPLDRDIAQALGRPIAMANDANCFALSEATDGAASGAHCVFGVIIGTGTGGGIVIDGRVLTGANAIAGEWGHDPLPWANADETPGPRCFCGKQGCIETFVSGPGLAADHERVSGRRVTAESIVEQAGAGDPDALATLARHANRMARGLAAVINLLDPDVIVLGGGVSNITSLYEEVPKRWGPYVNSAEIRTRLVQAAHGDSSGVRGAAWLQAPIPGPDPGNS